MNFKGGAGREPPARAFSPWRRRRGRAIASREPVFRAGESPGREGWTVCEGLGTTDGRRREARLPPGQPVALAADRVDLGDGPGAGPGELDEGAAAPAGPLS